MYLKKTTLAEEYDISIRTVESLIRFIRKRIGTRYPVEAVISTGKLIRVRDDVFRDALCYRTEIKRGTAPEFKENEGHIWNYKNA